MCAANSPATGVCIAALSEICGRNSGELELDIRILPTHLQYTSHAFSLKQLNHYLQLQASGKFRQYDYGQSNQQVYGSPSPPDYNLANVVAAVYVYSGGCDGLVAEGDIQRLTTVLPNVKNYRSLKNYNHCDFNYGKNARTQVFTDMVQAINGEPVDFFTQVKNFVFSLG